jgi:OYE-like second alpha/beta domain
VPVKNGITSYWPYEIPGWQQDNVVTPEDVYLGRVETGHNVLVYEDTNHHRGCGVCEFLADRGHKVEVLTRHPYVGMDLGLTLNQPIFYGRWFQKGIAMTPHHAVKSIDGKRVTVFNVYSNQERVIEGVDTVVMATVRKSVDALYFGLKSRVPELHRIGDCVQPRSVYEAFWEGFTTGRSL